MQDRKKDGTDPSQGINLEPGETTSTNTEAPNAKREANALSPKTIKRVFSEASETGQVRILSGQLNLSVRGNKQKQAPNSAVDSNRRRKSDQAMPSKKADDVIIQTDPAIVQLTSVSPDPVATDSLQILRSTGPKGKGANTEPTLPEPSFGPELDGATPRPPAPSKTTSRRGSSMVGPVDKDVLSQRLDELVNKQQHVMIAMPESVVVFVPKLPWCLDMMRLFFKAESRDVPERGTPEFDDLIIDLLNSDDQLSRSIELLTKNLNMLIPTLYLGAAYLERLRIIINYSNDVPLSSTDTFNDSIRYASLGLVNLAVALFAMGKYVLSDLQKKLEETRSTIESLGYNIPTYHSHSFNKGTPKGYLRVARPTFFDWTYEFRKIPEDPRNNRNTLVTQEQFDAYQRQVKNLEEIFVAALQQAKSDSNKWSLLSSIFNLLAPIFFDVAAGIRGIKNNSDNTTITSRNGFNTGMNIAELTVGHLGLFLGYAANRRHDIAERVKEISTTGLQAIGKKPASRI